MHQFGKNPHMVLKKMLNKDIGVELWLETFLL